MRDGKREYTIDSVKTALELLLLVGEMPGHGLSELARAADLSKARTFRMLQTLESSGFVGRTEKDNQYWLGPRARQLAEFARQQLDLASLLGPIIDALEAKTRETAQLRIRQGLDSKCIYVREPDRLVRYHGELGRLLPIHVGASKVLLAFASNRYQQAVLNTPLARLTKRTITDPAALADKLASIREDGFCISRGESDSDAISVGAPVVDPSGEVIAAIIVAAPASRTPEEAVTAMIKEVTAAARDCNEALQRSFASDTSSS